MISFSHSQKKSAIADLVGCVPYCNSYYPTDSFLGTHHAYEFLEASGCSLTTPMHTDRREVLC